MGHRRGVFHRLVRRFKYDDGLIHDAMSTSNHASDLLSDIPAGDGHGPSTAPLVAWAEDDAVPAPSEAERLLEHLRTGAGNVVCHFESGQTDWWLRYLPDRECYDWHVNAATDEDSYDSLDDYEGSTVARLQTILREDASAELHQAGEAPVTFAPADREVEQLPPEAFAQPDEPTERKGEQPDPGEYHPGTDDPRFPDTHDEFADLA